MDLYDPDKSWRETDDQWPESATGTQVAKRTP
jgi:hypothetical protein